MYRLVNVRQNYISKPEKSVFNSLSNSLINLKWKSCYLDFLNKKKGVSCLKPWHYIFNLEKAFLTKHRLLFKKFRFLFLKYKAGEKPNLFLKKRYKAFLMQNIFFNHRFIIPTFVNLQNFQNNLLLPFNKYYYNNTLASYYLCLYDNMIFINYKLIFYQLKKLILIIAGVFFKKGFLYFYNNNGFSNLNSIKNFKLYKNYFILISSPFWVKGSISNFYFIEQNIPLFKVNQKFPTLFFVINKDIKGFKDTFEIINEFRCLSLPLTILLNSKTNIKLNGINSIFFPVLGNSNSCSFSNYIYFFIINLILNIFFYKKNMFIKYLYCKKQKLKKLHNVYNRVKMKNLSNKSKFNFFKFKFF